MLGFFYLKQNKTNKNKKTTTITKLFFYLSNNQLRHAPQ